LLAVSVALTSIVLAPASSEIDGVIQGERGPGGRELGERRRQQAVLDLWMPGRSSPFRPG